MKVISVCNHKGGCAKTTTVVNIAAELINSGYKVLMIDNDYQANLTTSVGFKTDKESLVNCLRGKKSLRKTIKNCTILEGLDIIPNNSEIGNADLSLIKIKNCKRILSKMIEDENLKDDYDFILIDCPPSQSITTVNALVAADSVIVPIQCEYYALEGLSQLIYTINLIQERINPVLEIEGIVFTMYDARTNLSNQVVDNVKQNLNQHIYNTIIPRNVRLAESPSYGMPIIAYDPRSAGAEHYMMLADEVIANDYYK